MNDAARELIGRTVGGRFRLKSYLGEGSMAAVYRGEQDAEPRDVAVKIMHPALLRDASFAKRFSREAKAAARIVHPNSVRILEQGADGDLFYLAMELLVGQDLFDVLARERRLPEARAARIVVQVCGALEAAHAHGIVHRDLKPENVMILPAPGEPLADVVKVLDFGIAKILDRSSREDEPPRSEPAGGPMSSPPSSALTMVGALVGTPEYMSPEQATGQPVDARSDLYACGVLLYQMVTGRPPFKSDHVVEVLMSHADKPPPAPSTFWPDVHPGLEQVILKALSKRPDDRQQTAAQLAGELGALLAELTTSVRSGKARASSREAAVPGAPLPGVPSAVEIKAPVHMSEPPPPPDTLRSPPTRDVAEPGAPTLHPDDAAALDRVLPSEPRPAPPVVFDKTLSFDPTPVAGLPRTPAAKPQPAAVSEKTLSFDPTPPAGLQRTPAAKPEPKPRPAPAVTFEKTLTLETTPAAKPEQSGPVEEKKAPAAPVEEEKAPAAPPAEEKEAVVAASDPAAEERKPTPVPIQRLPAARGELPWWVFAVVLVLLCAAIWLMRYLRLGPE